MCRKAFILRMQGLRQKNKGTKQMLSEGSEGSASSRCGDDERSFPHDPPRLAPHRFGEGLVHEHPAGDEKFCPAFCPTESREPASRPTESHEPMVLPVPEQMREEFNGKSLMNYEGHMLESEVSVLESGLSALEDSFQVLQLLSHHQVADQGRTGKGGSKKEGQEGTTKAPRIDARRHVQADDYTRLPVACQGAHAAHEAYSHTQQEHTQQDNPGEKQHGGAAGQAQPTQRHEQAESVGMSPYTRATKGEDDTNDGRRFVSGSGTGALLTPAVSTPAPGFSSLELLRRYVEAGGREAARHHEEAEAAGMSLYTRKTEGDEWTLTHECSSLASPTLVSRNHSGSQSQWGISVSLPLEYTKQTRRVTPCASNLKRSSSSASIASSQS